MKTFWLYFGKIFVTAVRLPASATTPEVIMKALTMHDLAPCVNTLYPSHTPYQIRGMIAMATVKNF